MAKITYENKVALNENPEIADINKVKDTDMNQIKNVVNENETKELIAVSSTAPAECSTGDMYFNTTDNLIYTATATDTWSSTGTTPTDNTIYVVIADKVMYMYNGTTLVKLGSADIPQQATAPVNPKEDDLWIDTDDNTNLVGVVSSTTVSDKDTYSCNYLNQHLYDMYSENEVLTDKIWIDGRPVYRKVLFQDGLLSFTNNKFTINHGISNLKNIVSHNATLYDDYGSGTFLPLTYLTQSGANLTISFVIKSDVVEIEQAVYGSNRLKDLIVILEYTKTTDSGDR